MVEPITLGHLIDTLNRCHDEARVRFDFCHFAPDLQRINSYRGDYAQLAIGYDSPQSDPPTVAQLVAALKAALGSEFDGYKGGTYRMHKTTQVYVAMWGDWSQTAITGVMNEGEHSVVLFTAYEGA